MPLRTPKIHALRHLRPPLSQAQCICRSPRSLPPPSQFHPVRKIASQSKPPFSEINSVDPIETMSLHRREAELRAYYKRRSYYAGAGLVFCMVAMYLTATSVPIETPSAAEEGSSSAISTSIPNPTRITKLDSGRRADDPLVSLGRERKVVIQKLGEEPEEQVDMVPTGASAVPFFPRLLNFVDEEREKLGNGIGVGMSDDRLVEYTLVGCGVRTVSFLGVQVYAVGLYVATDDIASLQAALIHRIADVASTLVAGEKEELKAKLYDPEEGTRIWSEVLKNNGTRTIVRIVPTRNTDFGHLRDAWVRSVTARAQHEKEEYGDEAFGKSVQEFKKLFSRGSVPKQKELLLSRDKTGKLAVWYDDGKNGAQRLGEVKDERISRAVWLNYLAGKTVASEPARKSIVEGVMEFVERPVGTVATQVHV